VQRYSRIFFIASEKMFKPEKREKKVQIKIHSRTKKIYFCGDNVLNDRFI